jgi:hypothetical protein
MSDTECSLGLANCEPVTSWPTGWLLVAIVAIVAGSVWAFYRSR